MRYRPLAWLCLALALGLGCGRVRTVPVSGKITMGGNPVVDAQVGFISRDKQGISGIGMTDTKGNFTLRTFVRAGENLEGAIPGEYDVTVFKAAPPSFGASRRIRHLLPEKYSKPGCGLEAVVKEEVNNEFTFDLKAD